MHKWDASDPPEDAYGRVTDPGRFAPLHRVARQLLDELEARFEVTRQLFTETDPHAPDPAPGVRLVPADPAAASLAVVFDAFPGLRVRSGRHDVDGAHFPRCGCDACDESVAECTEELRNLIDTTTAGTFGERLVYADGAWWNERWYQASSSAAGSGRSRLDEEQLAVLREIMPGGELVWTAWPERIARHIEC